MTTTTQKKPGLRNKLIWVAVWLVLAAGLGFAASGLAWGRVFEAARQASLVWLPAALAANLIAIPLWALSWRFITPVKAKISLVRFTEVLAVVLSAVQAFSIFAGGATAYFLMVERLRLTRSAALSVLVLDQFTTGFVKALIIGLALTLPSTPPVLRGIGGLLVVVMIAATLALAYASTSRERLHAISARLGGRSGRALEVIGDWTENLDVFRNWPRMSAAILFMLARRLMEGIAAYCVARSLGIPVGPEIGLLVVASIAVVTLIPSPPGNIGLYEAAVVAAYQWMGVEAEVALAAALLQHAAALLAALTPGGLIVLFNPSIRKRTES